MGQSYLITGGSGSFGKACTRALLMTDAERICIFSRGEHHQEAMAREFKALDPHGRLRFRIGDVRDRDRLEMAMRGVDVVIHAAALKVVPICENDPMEAIKTNVLGTQNVVEAALRVGVKKVMFISTDKAPAASTLYGATKFAAERLVVASNVYAGDLPTRFSCVRYGNVIGSAGSVIPLFKRMVADGATELPVTDDRMTRFFWTLDDAVTFTLRSLERMRGGEVFVPKIAARRIVDIAHEIAPDLPVRIVGIRAGEKLHEVLISEDEARTAVDTGDCYVLCPQDSWWDGSHLCGEPVGEGFVYSSENAILAAPLLREAAE